MRITQTQSGQPFSTTTKGQNEQSDTPFTLDLDQEVSSSDQDSPSNTASGAPPNASANTVSAAFWNMGNTGAGTSVSTAVASDSGTSSLADSLADEFAQLADMSPAERIRAQYLRNHHLTEAQFDALPQNEQDGINQEIAKQIQRQLGGSDGKPPSDSDDSSPATLNV